MIILFIGCFIYNGNAQVKKDLSNGWTFLRQDLGSAWEAVRPVPRGGAETVPVWQPVSLPHTYNAEDAVDIEPNYYQGPAWYRSELKIENPYPNGRTLLHFEGAGQKTEIYIHTTRVGSHTGGYDEFTVDITGAVENFRKSSYAKQFKDYIPVLVRTDNSRDVEMIPSDLSDFILYGGIYRNLHLVYQPAVYIDKLFISPAIDDHSSLGSVNARIRLVNDDHQPLSSKLEVFDPHGTIVYNKTVVVQQPGTEINFPAFTINKTRRWSPDNPALYSMRVTLYSAEDSCTVEENFGFRSFSFREQGPFFLNGERLLLKGTHRHEDFAGVGAAMTVDMMRSEMIMIKNMGANFIRLGHYQQSRTILDLCDSLGLLVWEEIPWCRGGLGGPEYKDQARRMLTNMIEQHYNHPSVIIWGMGNENDWPNDFPVFEQDSIRLFMSELDSLSHQLDPSRKTAIRRCEFCRDLVDVYSPSIWMGWYRGSYADYKKESESAFKKNKHFLHVEWGGDSHAGRHSEQIENSLLQLVRFRNNPDQYDSLLRDFSRMGKDGDWSESYIINLFDWHLKEQEFMPWLTGTAFWTFRDFATPLRPENPVPYVNQKGVVERDGVPKESYFLFQSRWSNQLMAHIYGKTWQVRWGKEGEEKLVKVFSNGDEVELFLNGKSYGVKKRNVQDFPATGLYWPLVFRAGKNRVEVIARKGKQMVRDTIQFNYQVHEWKNPSRILLRNITGSNNLTEIEVQLVDVANMLCADASELVEFDLAGDGKLMINKGTASGSKKVQLKNGKAKIIIQNAGNTVISARIEGITTALLQLNADR